jgi:hypothetical protein
MIGATDVYEDIESQKALVRGEVRNVDFVKKEMNRRDIFC